MNIVHLMIFRHHHHCLSWIGYLPKASKTWPSYSRMMTRIRFEVLVKFTNCIALYLEC
jgi:hypothetical protein